MNVVEVQKIRILTKQQAEREKCHPHSLSDKYTAFNYDCVIYSGKLFCSFITTHMKAYKETQNLKVKQTRCMICSHSYSEFASDIENRFSVGRQFSSRNGFGFFFSVYTLMS